ncbi:MAG: xanthine dehydrogenase family protein molybdopterin-binding subunit [Hyphomonadaceae bacterium]
MADDITFSPSRRLVLQVLGLGAAGFAVGCSPAVHASGGPDDLLQLNPFVKVGADNTVTVILKHIEFGQGVSTGLSTIVAEEMDADWSQIRFEHSPANNALYGNTAFGGMMGTGGSTAIFDSWERMRLAGAGARAMLVAAAAEKWKVDPATIKISRGKLSAGSKSATFGELAEAAAKIPAPDPASLKLKDPSQFVLIGKEKAPDTVFERADTPMKIDGSAKYAMDYQPEGMLVALIARSPRFGGKVASFDDAAAKAVSGVTDVVQIANGVAVVATNFWAAKKGRDALKVTWDDSAAEKRSSDQMLKDYKAELSGKGSAKRHVIRNEGAGAKALAGSGKRIEADFDFPYLAHAPMEPLNCIVEYKPGESCRITSGSQMPTGDQATAAMILGLDPSKVTVDTRIAGGSFGRRATPDADLVTEAAQIAKAIGGRAPVHLMWTREDDIRTGKYRPMAVHRMAGRVAGDAVEAWSDDTAIQSIMEGTPFLPPGVIDESAVEGGFDIPYAIPNIEVSARFVKSPVSVLWWRSVGHTHTAYAKEHFLDQLAREAGQDPYELRKSLLSGDPRLLGVLNLVAEKAGWSQPLAPAPDGSKRGRGIAAHKSFNSYVAEVAEVSVKSDGSFSVDRVVCAVDCGVAINPDVIRAQMEGGIGYGLSAALGEAVTLKDGAPVQTNFYDYQVLRMAQMPKVEVYIVPSSEAPTGVGEPGVPPVGPAVANALMAATGKTFNTLPIGAKV